MNYKMVGRVLGMVLLCLARLMLYAAAGRYNIRGERAPVRAVHRAELALGLGLASIKPDSTDLFARDSFLRSALRGCSCRPSARCPIS